MGSGTFSASAYRAYTTTTRGKTTDEIYAARNLHKNLNPKGVKIRESRDSTDNPNSTPIIVALDVTGSMGILADAIAREGLGVLFNDILDRKPITDPHIMFMAVGDANFDSAPLQVSQFEADNRIVEQLTQIFLEHGGGGNSFESYNLPWYFAAAHTEHDSIIKRAKRGYLFTVGDEEAPHALTREQIETFIGDKLEREISSEEMLADAKRKYDVFHIMIAEGDHARGHPENVRQSWQNTLGQHAIWLTDHKKLAETIVGTIEVVEGRDAVKVKDRYGSAVYDAVKALPRSRGPKPLALPAA
jgi:hypothetical protein